MKEYKYKDLTLFSYESSDLTFTDRSKVTNKGDCGRLLVAGGEAGMAGACFFSALAAYRVGTGLVDVFSHKENAVILQTLIPEAIFIPWDRLKSLDAPRYTSAVAGIGMGKGQNAYETLSHLLSILSVPTVLDADALNIISENLMLLKNIPKHTVITPHLMEFSRLTGKPLSFVKEYPYELACEFSQKYSLSVVLKSNITFAVLARGESFVNVTGNSTLSKGGSGDVLTGILGGLLAQGLGVKEAVSTALFLHGNVGERVGERLGEHGALARDFANEIPYALSELKKEFL